MIFNEISFKRNKKQINIYCEEVNEISDFLWDYYVNKLTVDSSKRAVITLRKETAHKLFILFHQVLMQKKINIKNLLKLKS